MARNGKRDERRHERERKHEGGGQRDHHRHRHRPEHLALDAAEGEQGRVDEDDDRLSIKRRADHLACGFRHRAQAFGLRECAAGSMLTLGQLAQAVFGDDNRTIHDETEI